MKYKLICLDIDGTLLDDEKRLLPDVRDQVGKAAAQGMKIVLGSARMPAGVELIEKELGLKCIKICDAGAYILDGEQCISSRHMPARIMKEIYEEYAEKNHLNMWIFRDRDWYITGTDRYTEREVRIIGYDPRIVDLKERAQQWEKEQTGPSKLLIAADPEKIREIRTGLQTKLSLGVWQEIDAACSAEEFLEIFPRGVDKGSALREVRRRLQIPQKETVAFGDSEVDLSMLEEAGFSVAMGNAPQHVKDRADYVTETNNEAGVARTLEKILSEQELI